MILSANARLNLRLVLLLVWMLRCGGGGGWNCESVNLLLFLIVL